MTRAGVECLGCPVKLDPKSQRFRIDELPDGNPHKHGYSVGYLCPKCLRITLKALAKQKYKLKEGAMDDPRQTANVP